MQDSRKKVSMQTVIGEMCGAVSLCWNPKPTGVFDSEQATKFVNEAIAEVQAGIEQYVLSEKVKLLKDIREFATTHSSVETTTYIWNKLKESRK